MLIAPKIGCVIACEQSDTQWIYLEVLVRLFGLIFGSLRLAARRLPPLAGSPAGSRSLADFIAGKVWATYARRHLDALRPDPAGLADLQVNRMAAAYEPLQTCSSVQPSSANSAVRSGASPAEKNSSSWGGLTDVALRAWREPGRDDVPDAEIDAAAGGPSARAGWWCRDARRRCVAGRRRRALR